MNANGIERTVGRGVAGLLGIQGRRGNSFLSLCIGLCVVICGQTEILLAQDSDPMIETLVDPDDGMTSPEDLARLGELRRTPLDINSAEYLDWEQLPWLSANQITAILNHRAQQGPFPTINTLLSIPGIDEELLERLRPFLKRAGSPIKTSGWARVSDRGNGPLTDPGSGIRVAQATVRIGNQMEWGGSLERRDAGKTRQAHSGYFSLMQTGWLDRVVVGTLEADFGQGLVLGSPAPISFGSSFTTPVKTIKQGLKGSSHLQGKLRGVAVQGRIRSFLVVVLQTENNRQSPARGLRVTWMRQRARLSATFAERGTSGAPDSARRPTAGIDFDGVIGRVNLFGEFAYRSNGYRALQTGLRWNSGKLEGGLVLGIRQEPTGRQESGSYRGVAHIQWKPERGTILQITAGARFEDAAPVLVQSIGIRRRTGKRLTLMGVWRQEKVERLTGEGDDFNRLQAQIDYLPVKMIRLRTTAEWTRWNTGRWATQTLVDARYRAAARSSLSVQWRRSVRGQVSPDSPSTRNTNGSRWMVLCQRSLSKAMDCSVRWGRTELYATTPTPLPKTDYSWSIQLTTVW